MAAYYNEIDPYAAQWLRNLMAAGHIAQGEVDERSIVDVAEDDVRGFEQCHFFAGIAGWSLALRLAGWSDERPVWTGSCPCQPFSLAGKRKGFDDQRHLWPEFRRLISERRPTVVLGEQVAGASDWLRVVRSDLEEVGYAVGAIPVEAACAGADHFRDRFWFVAHDDKQLSAEERIQRSRQQRGAGGPAQNHPAPLADGHGHGHRSQITLSEPSNPGSQLSAAAGNSIRNVVNLARIGWGEGWTEDEFRRRGFTASVAICDGSQFVECSDGKWRRLPPPRVRWLGTRIPARVAKLRAIGNSIDPRPAAAFIAAVMECRP